MISGMVDIPVLVPHGQGVRTLTEVPGINPLRYDPKGELPPGAERAQDAGRWDPPTTRSGPRPACC